MYVVYDVLCVCACGWVCSGTTHALDQKMTVVWFIMVVDVVVVNVGGWAVVICRWFGVGHSSSDYDYLAVVSGYTQPKTDNVVQGDDIDVAVQEIGHFQRM